MDFIFFIYNRKDCSESLVQNISFHDELSIKNPVYKNESGDECLFEGVESITIEGIELLGNVLLDKACQWNNNVWVVEDKLAVEVSETWIFLTFLGFSQSWIIFTLSLDMVRPERERIYSRYSTNSKYNLHLSTLV